MGKPLRCILIHAPDPHYLAKDRGFLLEINADLPLRVSVRSLRGLIRRRLSAVGAEIVGAARSET